MVIQSGDYTAVISSQGGSILQAYWKDRMFLGTPKLVEKSDGAKSWRGVSHWCWPYWGPSPYNPDFPKHGTLRDAALTCRRQNPTELVLSTGELQHSRVDVTNKTSEIGIITSLTYVQLRSRPVRVLPASHPYFPIPHPLRGATIHIGHEQISTTIRNDLGKAKLIERMDRFVRVHLRGLGMVKLRLSDNCTHIAVWTDNRHEYVCVEPIFGDPAKPSDREVIVAPDTYTWSVGFDFEPE